MLKAPLSQADYAQKKVRGHLYTHKTTKKLQSVLHDSRRKTLR